MAAAPSCQRSPSSWFTHLEPSWAPLRGSASSQTLQRCLPGGTALLTGPATRGPAQGILPGGPAALWLWEAPQTAAQTLWVSSLKGVLLLHIPCGEPQQALPLSPVGRAFLGLAKGDPSRPVLLPRVPRGKPLSPRAPGLALSLLLRPSAPGRVAFGGRGGGVPARRLPRPRPAWGAPPPREGGRWNSVASRLQVSPHGGARVPAPRRCQAPATPR